MEEEKDFLKVWGHVSHTKTNLLKLADWFVLPLSRGEEEGGVFTFEGVYSMWTSYIYHLCGPKPVSVSKHETNTGSWKEYFELLPGTAVLQVYEGPEGVICSIINNF